MSMKQQGRNHFVSVTTGVETGS